MRVGARTEIGVGTNSYRMTQITMYNGELSVACRQISLETDVKANYV